MKYSVKVPNDDCFVSTVVAVLHSSEFSYWCVAQACILLRTMPTGITQLPLLCIQPILTQLKQTYKINIIYYIV